MFKFILVVVMFIVVIGMLFTAFYFLKKNDPNLTDTSNMSTAQDFLPFVDIRDDMIHLDNNEYRAVIEVSSVNYDLRNESEQDLIEISFRRLLDSLGHDFPITLYISTRDMDYTQLIESMLHDYTDTLEVFPGIENYLQQNLADMKALAVTQEDTQHKRKYIIIPFNANTLGNLSGDGSYAEVLNSITQRVAQVQDGISSIIGASSTRLDTIDLIDLVVETYNRDGVKFGAGIEETENKRADLLSVIISGNNNVARPQQFTEEETYDMFLTRMQAQLEDEFLNNERISPKMRQDAQEMWERIHITRQDDDFHGLKVKNHEKRFDEIREKEQALTEYEQSLADRAERVRQEEQKIASRAEALELTESELSKLAEDLDFEQQIESGEVITFGPTEET